MYKEIKGLREKVQIVETSLETAEIALRELAEYPLSLEFFNRDDFNEAAESILNQRVGVIGVWYRSLENYEKTTKKEEKG